jgi:arginyl-tRNA synthetase
MNGARATGRTVWPFSFALLPGSADDGPTMDPAAQLAERFAAAIPAALGSEYAGTDPVIRRSQQPQFGDYQANVAMSLAKRVGAAPRDIAARIVEQLDVDDLCERVEVAGPGFVNLTLRPGAIAAALRAASADERAGVPVVDHSDCVVVDYSSPNVAKEMHVGHLRSTIIGDALVRVLAFQGHDVVRQNHLGDWGTQFGMLIEHLIDEGWDASGDHTISDLNALYQEAQGRFSSDEEFADRARRRVVSLQSGDEQTLAVWRGLVAESERHMQEVYDRLGVLLTPDDIRGESFYNPMLPGVVSDLEAKGLTVVDDGAVCVFPPGFTRRDGEPLPMIVRKSDGGFGYDATDLAGVRFRTTDLGGNRLVYVVDARQSQHFQMVFAVARLAGWLGEGGRAEHVAFGTILGEDNKPFKTRSGGTVRLIELLEEAETRAAAIVAERSDLPPEDRAAVARAVGVGAVKYADLSNDRVKDYVFAWDRMLAMEGNTAPYLQYAHARIQSIFRRAEESEGASAVFDDQAADQPAERALALQLLSLGAVVDAVAESLQPHRLCTYLFELAQAFTSFYEQCPVLRADTAEQRANRLALCHFTARVLKLGLELLGIDAPDRM